MIGSDQHQQFRKRFTRPIGDGPKDEEQATDTNIVSFSGEKLNKHHSKIGGHIPQKFTDAEKVALKELEYWGIDQHHYSTTYFGETDEGDEWFIMTDAAGTIRCLIDKLEGDQVRFVSNHGKAVNYNTLKQAIEHGWSVTRLARWLEPDVQPEEDKDHETVRFLRDSKAKGNAAS